MAYNSMFCTKDGCFSWGENTLSYSDTNDHSRWKQTRVVDPDNMSYLINSNFAFSVGDFSYYLRQLYKSYNEKYETACNDNLTLLAYVDEDGSVTKNITFMFSNLDGTTPSPDELFQACWFSVYDWSGDESLTLATIGVAAFDPSLDLIDAKQVVSDLKKQTDGGEIIATKDLDNLRIGCSSAMVDGAYTFTIQKIPPAELSASDFVMDYPDSNIYKDDIITNLKGYGRESFSYAFYDPDQGDTEQGAFVTPRGIRYGAKVNDVREAYGYSSDYLDVSKLDDVVGSSGFYEYLANGFDYSSRFKQETVKFLHYDYSGDFHMIFFFNNEDKLTWIVFAYE